MRKNDAEELILKTHTKKTINLPDGHIPVGTDGTNGLFYAIEQLSSVPSTTQVIMPVTSFDDVINASKHDPLSALNIIQLSVDKKDKTTIHITEYFRSMEVYNYLPLNLYETMIIAKEVRNNFPDIKKINLGMHIFRAEYDVYKTSANKMCDLDIMNATYLAAFLARKDYDKLISLFTEKQTTHNYGLCKCFEDMNIAIISLNDINIEIPQDVIDKFNILYNVQKEVMKKRFKLISLEERTNLESTINEPMQEFVNVLKKQKRN